MALVALLVGVSLTFILPRSATITLAAAPGGHITPSGPITVAVGSQLQITMFDDDPSWQVGLMVGGQIAAPTPVGNGRYVYTLTVTGDTSVQASFAQLAADVRLMDTATGAAIASVSPDQSQVTFSRDTPVVDQLAVGDVLVNGAGSGYPHSLLVRVQTIAHIGSTVVLTTVPVPLTAAVLQASVQLNVPMPLTVPATVGPTGSPTALTPFGPAVAMAADTGMNGFQMSLAHTWTGQSGGASGSASVDGELSVSAPSLNVDLHISLNLFPPSGTVDLFQVSVSEHASASLTLDAQAAYAMKQEAMLIDRDLAMIWFAVGPVPVEVSPHLGVGVGIDVSATGHLHAVGGLSGSLESGVRYQNGIWSPIQQYQIQPEGSVTLEAAATARVYPILNLSANIYGLCGPYIDIQPGFLDLAADVNADPWWTLDAGVRLAAGAKCDFTDPYDLAGGDVLRETVATAGGPLIAVAPPSATTAPTVDLPVIACDTNDAGWTGTPPPAVLPSVTVPIPLAGDIGGDLAAYWVEYSQFVLGPANGQCNADIGEDGGGRVTIRSTTDAQARVTTEFGLCRRRYPLLGLSRRPRGERPAPDRRAPELRRPARR